MAESIVEAINNLTEQLKIQTQEQREMKDLMLKLVKLSYRKEIQMENSNFLKFVELEQYDRNHATRLIKKRNTDMSEVQRNLSSLEEDNSDSGLELEKEQQIN